MILNFKHKGLKRLYEADSTRGVRHDHVNKLRNILARLDVAIQPEDLTIPGFRLHRLKGKRKETWSIKVSANWRVTFRFLGDNVADVDYEDYH